MDRGSFGYAGFSWFNLASKLRASLVAQLVKNLPAMGETWVRSLSWEDPLEKGLEDTASCPVSCVATPPCTVSVAALFRPCGEHGQRSLAGCSPWGHKELDMTELNLLQLTPYHFIYYIIFFLLERDLFGAEPFDPFNCGAGDFPPDIQSKLDEMQVIILTDWPIIFVSFFCDS